MKKFICNLLLVSLLKQKRFVTFDAHFMALNKLHKLSLPSFGLPSHVWVTFASHYDSVLFLHRIDKCTILLLLYVDDMIITGDNLNDIQ